MTARQVGDRARVQEGAGLQTLQAFAVDRLQVRVVRHLTRKVSEALVQPVKLRALALVPYPHDKAPGQRFRMEQWAPRLGRLGAEVTFESFRREELHRLLSGTGHTWRKVLLTSRAPARRAGAVKRVKDYDLVYVYNEAAVLGPALIEKYLRAKGVPLVFDAEAEPPFPPGGGYNASSNSSAATSSRPRWLKPSSTRTSTDGGSAGRHK